MVNFNVVGEIVVKFFVFFWMFLECDCCYVLGLNNSWLCDVNKVYFDR